MLKVFLLLFLFIFSSRSEESPLNSKSFVHLTGKPTYTIVQNSTKDTVKLKGNYFCFLDYRETNYNLVIAPGDRDTLVTDLSYPDFINIGDFRIFNSPGKIVLADILDIKPRSRNIKFEQDLTVENNYYQAYQKHFGGFAQESRAYYAGASKLQDLNKFPPLADSIGKQNLAFLENYKTALLPWFKEYESWRLKYNNGFRKYHIPFDKEFKGGGKIRLDKDYYNFEKHLPLDNNLIILNNDFLWYAMFYIRQQSLSLNVPENKNDPMLYVIDSLFKEKEIGDILKIKRLLDMSRGETGFKRALNNTTFNNKAYKQVLDSILYRQVGLPLIGKKSPDATLNDIYDKEVSLSSLNGRVIIINFWASWCSPCLKEFPFENKLYKEYKNRGITVVNICVSTDKAKWIEISKTNKLEMVNLYAGPNQSIIINQKFDLSSLPKSIVLDNRMVVRENHFKRASQVSSADIKQILTDNR